jgi:Plasmid pRiA4b ORF-3-like protein
MSKQQSIGKCNLCGALAGKASMTRHLRACSQPEASAQRPPAPSFHLAIEGGYANAYWMHVAVPVTAPLGELDDFLRHTWVECCDHLSVFAIGGKRYAYQPMDQEMSMTARLSQLLEVGMKFTYKYDYGSATDLVLKVVALREQTLPKGGVQLLARNEAPQVSCQRCSIQPATQICTDCASKGDGWLCEACAVAHECGDQRFLPVVNSPRVGVCGYSG